MPSEKGYEIQSAARTLLERPEKTVDLSDAARPDAFAVGEKVFIYPTGDDETKTPDVLAETLPFLEELGISQEDLEQTDDWAQTGQVASIAVMLVKTVGDAKVPLTYDHSLRLQAQVVRAFVEARRYVHYRLVMVDSGRVEKLRAQGPDADSNLTEREYHALKAKVHAITAEAVADLPTDISKDVARACERHFDNATFFGMNAGFADIGGIRYEY